MVLGGLQTGRLSVYWIEGELRRSASRSVQAAPYAGDVLDREVVAELMGQTIAREVEARPVEYLEVDRSEPEGIPVPSQPDPVALAEEPGPVETSTQGRVGSRMGWWLPVGVSVLGASAGLAWFMNERATQGDVSSPRYTVLIEAPR